MKAWTTLFLAGAAVTAACLAAAPAALGQDADALVAKGKALVQKGDWPGARDAFLAAVKKDARNLEARRGAADSLLGLGMSDEAVEQAFAGLDLVKNEDAGLWLLAARGYLQKAEGLPAEQTQEIGDAFADAKAKASEALKRDPGLALARVVLSKACRLTNEAARAAGVVKEGLEKSPKDFDLNFEMGMVQLKNTDWEGALKSFDAAAAADPKSAETQYQRAMALAYLKRTDDCYAGLVKSAVLDPSTTRALQLIAKWQKDKPEKGVPWYRAVVKEKPDHAWGHAYLAYGLARTGDESGALTESKAAMGLKPDAAAFIDWHGQILDTLKRGPEALAYAHKALEKDPRSKWSWDRLGAYACDPRSGAKMDERKDLIDFLGKARPDDGLFWNNAGLVFRDQAKDYRRALDAYLKAAKLSPNDQGIQNDTGLIFLYHGPSIGVDPVGGLPYFERTLALVEEENQAPEMGYRDTLENLTAFYMTVDKNPEKCLEYARKRNDPEFLRSLGKDLGHPSPRAEEGRAWAEGELKKKR
jgi:tetratricopeptide (TPR) repeat protein